ncbi:uncharacterized protein LOC118423535 [Branchiostoma floridae]|uniref:Uncharacterized protein LOC118423535 n=1 Tax=Branchiostoma floridae TaxID=7739 RepID=A0A9J7LSW9_BRAFL|nr:uncharacterized protein LOC118423535 [Branchiostoma floridae]
MPPVPIHLGATPAPVWKDSVAMDTHVQMMTSVLRRVPVMNMPPVPTHLGATPVLVTKDTLAMETLARRDALQVLSIGTKPATTSRQIEKHFFSAERDCDSRRAKLVVWPDSATHQYLIENAKSKRNIWIGLSDRGQEGEFVWSNGDSLGSFHHWKGHNFPRAHCVAMMKRRGTYVLGVKLCAANCNYFCQRTAATNP